MVTADFGPEIELTLFLRMRAKDIAIEVAGANGRVRFLTGSFEIAVSAHAQLK